MAAAKKTPAGLAQRLQVLARFAREPAAALAEARSRYPRSAVADDDIVDAMVTAVAAQVAGTAGLSSLPPSPERDAYGLRMAIVYPGAINGRKVPG